MDEIGGQGGGQVGFVGILLKLEVSESTENLFRVILLQDGYILLNGEMDVGHFLTDGVEAALKNLDAPHGHPFQLFRKLSVSIAHLLHHILHLYLCTSKMSFSFACLSPSSPTNYDFLAFIH